LKTFEMLLVIACLVMVADDPDRSLTAPCREEITSRRAMWKDAAMKVNLQH